MFNKLVQAVVCPLLIFRIVQELIVQEVESTQYLSLRVSYNFSC